MHVEKMVAFYTSRDAAINEPLVNAGKAVGRYGTFDEAFERHAQAWDELWDLCDVVVPKDDRVQLLLRLHISHVLQVCSPHTADLDAGVPARGLNGEAYRGHIFWDELYIYPFLNFRLPEVTRGFLMYRYRRMEEARAAAKEEGFEGAMFPWQSGSDGQEETQKVHINPNSGKWEPDLSHNQRHVSADIFYNIWHYYEVTEDLEFLLDYGAEMMLDIARFWASIAHFNPERDRFEIHGVMGPDEFHEKYYGSDEGGLKNNAYTNVMVAWLCEIALEVLDMLPERRRKALTSRLGLTDEEIEKWDAMSRKMFVPFHEDPEVGGGLVSQFEGYEDLGELDWDHYREEYGNIQRLDRILRAEGDDPDKYKLTKQADAVLLFFLFPGDELERIFNRLGYDYDAGDGAQEHRLLRQADLPRLDPELYRARRHPRGHRPGQLVGAVHGGAGERRRRRPGRHHPGGHPHGRDGRDAGPDTARLPRHRHPRRGAVLRPEARGQPRRSVLLPAVPRGAAEGRSRRRRADGRRPPRRPRTGP